MEELFSISYFSEICYCLICKIPPTKVCCPVIKKTTTEGTSLFSYHSPGKKIFQFCFYLPIDE